jgi:hypothetical protein
MNKSGQKYISVYSASGLLEAEMICGFLKSYEIDAIHNQESIGVTYGLVLAPLGTAEIYVPEEFVDRAKELLRLMEQGKLENGLSEDENGNLK